MESLNKKERKFYNAPLDVNQIMEILPHRYPFLLVDKVIEMTETKIVGIKNVTMNEPQFQGHFPQRPIMPGVLMMEALAQLAGVLVLSKPEYQGQLAFYASIDQAKFRKIVVPGDVLRLEIEVLSLRSKMAKVYGRALVDGNVAAEGILMFAVGK